MELFFFFFFKKKIQMKLVTRKKGTSYYGISYFYLNQNAHPTHTHALLNKS